MKRTFFGRQLLGVSFIFLTLSGQLAHSADHKLSMTGSSTVAPLALEIAKRFESLNPGVRVDVQTGGSSRGIADARNGTADFGLVSRALKAEEKDLRGHTIALDGIAVIVHKTNPVTNLSNEQLTAIYTGTIQNWKALGGKDQKITVVNKAEGRSTLELFANYLGLRNSQIMAQVVVGDNQQGIKTVAGNPAAIGYVSIGSAEVEIENGVPLKMLPMNGVKPTTENVRNGTFPLSRPLLLVTKGQDTELRKRFLNFARSPAVDDLIKEQYFVPIGR